ncbi:MAG: ATP-binding protein [Rhodobacterales bacterium]|nr:ATP-binding protein [Rhodobacterales bacterium]
MPDPAANGARFSLGFPADPAEVRQALTGLLAAPAVSTLVDSDRGTVELVLAEVLNNIVEHAYAGGTGPVEVDLWATASGLNFQVADAGNPMPEGTLPDGHLPDFLRSGDGPTVLSDLPEGGFGWHLIRSLTRDLTYARQGGRNLLSFAIPLDG